MIAINNCFHNLFGVLSILWLATASSNKLKSRQCVASTSAALAKNMGNAFIINIKFSFFNNEPDVLLKLVNRQQVELQMLYATANRF